LQLELKNAKDLNDINFPLLTTSNHTFLFQKFTSKFENLRNYIPSSLQENLEEAFFHGQLRKLQKIVLEN